MTRVAVIGAGWAGAAAALTLARAGVNVAVFEAAKSVGGRARGVEKDGRNFDNGQHLLLGAYQRSIAMITSLHEDVDQVLLRTPLALNTAPGVAASLTLRAPRFLAPLHLLSAIVGARGLSLADKFSTLIWAARYLRYARPVGLQNDLATVADILIGQPEAACRLLWEPLCVAALNTPAATACAQVFIHVLRQTFMDDANASDLLIPRVDLSQLLPLPALLEVTRLGGEVRLGCPVMAITRDSRQIMLATRDETRSFDRVVVATGPQHVARLLAGDPESRDVVATLGALTFEPITTLHFEFSCTEPSASTAMLMLDGDPGQWLFWQRLGTGHWRASVVISAHHRSDADDSLTEHTLAQLRCSYRLPAPTWHQTITERRATYACTPSQHKSLSALPKRMGRLHFAGDWCFPALPATLEAAIISGEDAARLILTDHREG
jgi:hydroxysqualene dehydroxylase